MTDRVRRDRGGQGGRRRCCSCERLGETSSAADGSFSIDLAERIKPGATGNIEVTAKAKDGEAKQSVPMAELTFVPPQFRPMADQVVGTQGDRHIFRPSGVSKRDSETGRDRPSVGVRSQSPACEQLLDGIWRLSHARKYVPN